MSAAIHRLWPALLGALGGHPRTRLALAAALLDPLPLAGPDAREAYPCWEDDDPQAGLLYALDIARRCFPDLYVTLAGECRRGVALGALERACCAALNARYDFMDLTCFEDLAYGVPCQWAGVEPWQPDFATHYAALSAALRAGFDLQPDPDSGAFDEDALLEARACAHWLARSLATRQRQPYADLGWLLLWLFALSGNALIDHTPDSYYDLGYDPLDWEPDVIEDVALAHREAAAILDAAQRGLDCLNDDPGLRAALRRNARRLQHSKGDFHRVRLTWPERPARAQPGGCPPGASGPDAAVLQLRDHFAAPD